MLNLLEYVEQRLKVLYGLNDNDDIVNLLILVVAVAVVLVIIMSENGR